MYEKDQKVQKDVPESYEETAAVDMRRKRLLYDARLYSPIDMVLRVDKLTQTVLLPLLRHPVTWIVSLVYSASAIGARYGGLQYGDLERDTFDGTNSMVTFMVVFYVGYCYSRFGSMFQDLEQVMRGVINCSAVARGSFRSKRALYDLWRYLNLLHVTAYCGVTTTYSKQNLLDHFAHHYALLIYPEVEKKLFSIDIDNHGALAANTCMVWALEVVQERFDRGDFSAPMHKEMTETITAIGTGLARLYAQEYQVLPYIYTHLVSISCTIFLVGNAFLKGLYFEPDASLTFGLALPLASILLMTLTILGLLEIGAILANPLGPNKEAFAICHFVNYACSASREIVATDRAPTLTPRMPPEPTVRTESKMDKSVRAEGSDMSAATASPSATDHDLEATIEELKQLVSEQATTLKDMQAQDIQSRMEANQARKNSSASLSKIPQLARNLSTVRKKSLKPGSRMKLNDARASSRDDLQEFERSASEDANSDPSIVWQGLADTHGFNTEDFARELNTMLEKQNEQISHYLQNQEAMLQEQDKLSPVEVVRTCTRGVTGAYHGALTAAAKISNPAKIADFSQRKMSRFSQVLPGKRRTVEIEPGFGLDGRPLSRISRDTMSERRTG